MAKKLMALLLAVLMAVSLLPMPALAAEGTADLTKIAGGGDFTLTADTTLTKSLEITGNVTLDLGGHTVKFSPENTEDTNLSAIIITSGSLTLKGKGTISVPDAATAVSLAGNSTVLTVQDDVSITGGVYGVKTSAGTSGVKIAVNTTGKISAGYGILLSGKDAAAVSITAGTVCGTSVACGYVEGDGETVTALTASAVRAEGSVLYVDGSEAGNDTALAAGMFVFDDGKAPGLTVVAKRTEEKKASVSISATKAGTYYYQLDGESEPAAEDLFALEGSKTTLAKGANALELDIADGAEHKLYLAAQDAFGHKSDVVTVTIPAVLAAPENAAWGGEDGKTATWTAAEGVSYTVQLLKGETMVKEYTPVTTADCAADIAASGDGSYTFRVCAIGENTVGAWAVSSAITVDSTAPVITPGDAVRSALNAASFPFKSSEAGTLYYVLNTEPADIFAAESSTMAVQEGENTLELSLTDSAAVTVYYAAKDKEGNASPIATVVVPAYEEPADTTPPTVSDTAGQRTGKDTGSVTLTSDEAGKLYYVVGGEAPATADALIADPNKKEQPVSANEEVKLDLTGLPTDAVNVYLLVKDAAGNASQIATVTVPLYEEPADTTPPTVSGTAGQRTGKDTGSVTLKSDEAGTLYYVVGGEAPATADALIADANKKEQPVNANEEVKLDLTGLPTDAVNVYLLVKDAAGNASQIATVTVPLYEEPADTTPPTVSGTAGQRTGKDTGSVTLKSDEAGTLYYVVGGEAPATADALLANANKKEQSVNANEEVKLDLTGLPTDAVNVYLLVKDAAGNASEIKTVTVPRYLVLAKPTAATWLNDGTTAMWGAVTDATAYNVRLLKDGSEYGNVIVVNGGMKNTVELKDSMKDDGVYTFRVQATAGETQSEWSDVSLKSYTRDTTPPTITSHPSSRKDAKTAEFSFTSSEQGTYYYMIGTVGGGQPTVEQVVNDANPHGGCTQNAKTIIKLSDIADTNARIAYVVVRDKSGNLSRTSDGKPYAIQIPAYTSQPTATPTAAPTATPTAAPTTYTVTLQGGTGYTIAATGGSKSPVNAGGSFSFTVTPNNGYTRGTGFAVKANGTTLTSNNGVYTISNINANQTVSVSGIVQKSTSGGTLPAAPAITTTTLAAATMGKEYRQQLTATGGTPITWSYSGTLPDGMTLAANTGILSGTPTQEGSFRFAVKATNSTGFSTRQMTLVVAGSEYTVTKGANSEWTQGGDKGIDLSGSGKGSFTVKVDGAAVPAGKYTASSDGSTITLKPEYLDTLAAGSHTVTLVYTDGSAKAKFTIKAKDKTVAPTVSSQPLNAEAAEGSSATFTVTASGTTPLLCQWQVDKNDGKGWTDIIGAVNASYTVETITAEQNGWKYRCVIKNAAGSVESNAATLTVKEAIGDVKKNDDTKNNSSNRLGRILLITGIVVAVLALGAGLYFYFRRRNSTRYMD